MLWKDWISNADLCQCFKHLLLLPSSSLNLEGHLATGRVMSHSSATITAAYYSSLWNTTEKHHGRLVTKHHGRCAKTPFCSDLWPFAPDMRYAVGSQQRQQQRVATKSGQHTFFLVRRSSALHRVSLDNKKQLWLWSDPVPQNHLQISTIFIWSSSIFQKGWTWMNSKDSKY